ncbi:MAG: channel accessory protein ArfB [Mycobacterium sp.]
MAFMMEWFWYLLAFVLGSALAWGGSVLLIKHTSEAEALADLPTEIGGPA